MPRFRQTWMVLNFRRVNRCPVKFHEMQWISNIGRKRHRSPIRTELTWVYSQLLHGVPIDLVSTGALTTDACPLLLSPYVLRILFSLVRLLSLPAFGASNPESYCPHCLSRAPTRQSKQRKKCSIIRGLGKWRAVKKKSRKGEHTCTALTWSTKWLAVNCRVNSEYAPLSYLPSSRAFSTFIFLMPLMSFDIFSSAIKSVFCDKNDSFVDDKHCILMLRVGAANGFAGIFSVRRSCMRNWKKTNKIIFTCWTARVNSNKTHLNTIQILYGYCWQWLLLLSRGCILWWLWWRWYCAVTVRFCGIQCVAIGGWCGCWWWCCLCDGRNWWWWRWWTRRISRWCGYNRNLHVIFSVCRSTRFQRFRFGRRGNIGFFIWLLVGAREQKYTIEVEIVERVHLGARAKLL